MVDKGSLLQYTKEQVEDIAWQAARTAAGQVLRSLHLDNGTVGENVPTMKGENSMGRQKVRATLPNGEKVWITGDTFSDLIQNALEKYGSMCAPKQPVSNETFKEYTDHIYEVFLRPRWKPSTAETNKFLLDKHIMPFFGEYPIGVIDTVLIQRFFQTKQHLSKSYTRQMLIMLHEIFENAVEDGKIKTDPTKSKCITLPQKATKRNALEDEQFQEILKHINELEGEEQILIALLCYTGMRRGEILGLKWDCVYEDRIVVQAEVIYKGNQPIYCDYTKSFAGTREIPIQEELKPYLKNRGTGFVLGGEFPYTQCKFERTWQRIERRINLYNASPHIFRHTYLSMLAASDVDPKTIQAIAGHADFGFTFNRYIDKNKRNVQEAGSQLSERLRKLTQKVTVDEGPEGRKINEFSEIPAFES